MFSVVAKKSRTFSSFSYSAYEQACRSWEGAQADRPSWPMETFHTMDAVLNLWIEVGQGLGISALFLSVSLYPLLSRSLNFCGSLVFFESFEKLAKSASSGFHDRCLGADCELVIRRWENCIVYSLFCIVIIIIISCSISVFFVVLLNYLYLNPWVSPFVHFSSSSCCEG